MQEQQTDENELIQQRREKLKALRKKGIAFPNDFRRDHYAADLIKNYSTQDNETLEKTNIQVKIAGRMMLKRIMGKASFIQIQDMTGRIQCYIRQNDLPDGVYEDFKMWDLGDIVGIAGFVFKTKTGELSVHAKNIRLLTKSLRPLPDKFHGLADQEACYRQRYLDLIANESSRRIFMIRSKIVQYMRDFFNERRFLEVETPMMQTIPGGANARPFITHHNALDMKLYMRIAPELFLKRLVVGGFERVYEINRNFRNEGISTKHNPEFSMLEFYQAYATYHDLIALTEELLQFLAEKVLGTMQITYQGHTFDVSKPFAKMTMKNAILHFNPAINEKDLANIISASKVAEKLGIELKPTYGLGKIQTEIFDKTVEHRLIDPTFITEYPAEVSPLARRNDQDPFITDRFEFFIVGREIANGYSELNDPEAQADCFRKQAQEKAAGDEEAMHYDEDYITALEYGMPPTAGEGMGIDRLAMLFTDASSIRDVILFPLMRPIE
ncbi:MAG: lysine--tRNA ligase [Gammaproteobacteria bacterium]|nr:lysine--tRNA ligase [Gammaproteobacteria bacterium]